MRIKSALTAGVKSLRAVIEYSLCGLAPQTPIKGTSLRACPANP